MLSVEEVPKRRMTMAGNYVHMNSFLPRIFIDGSGPVSETKPMGCTLVPVAKCCS